MVAILFTLPMGWKTSSPIFCTATYTVTDLLNVSLHCNKPFQPHKLDNYVEAVVISDSWSLQPALAELNLNPTA